MSGFGGCSATAHPRAVSFLETEIIDWTIANRNGTQEGTCAAMDELLRECCYRSACRGARSPRRRVAKIVVYRDGKEVGDAIYDSPKAGMSLTFRIYESTASKIETMVNQLFPNGRAG